MGLNVRLYNIVSNGPYTLRYKTGTSPYPETTDSTFTLFNTGLTSNQVTISGLSFNTQYWIKMTDESTGRYIIKNIYTHDTKAYPCYDSLCFDIDATCTGSYMDSSPTPTPTPTVTPTKTLTPTPSKTPSVTPSKTPSHTPSVTPTKSVTPTPSKTPSHTPSKTPTPTPTPSSINSFSLTYSYDKCDACAKTSGTLKKNGTTFFTLTGAEPAGTTTGSTTVSVGDSITISLLEFVIGFGCTSYGVAGISYDIIRNGSVVYSANGDSTSQIPVYTYTIPSGTTSLSIEITSC